MKTLLSIFMVVLFGTAVLAHPESKSDYIITKDGKVVFAKVKLGILSINAKQINGEKLKVNYHNVLTFQKDGEIYAQKPLYEGNKKTDKVAFMKLLSWRNGLSLYCYEDPSLSKENNKRYFVFKDENTLWLEVEPSNAENIRSFFNKL